MATEKNGNGVGRPSKLTTAVKKKLIDAIAAGNYYEAACRYAGITFSTFRNWMNTGETAKTGQYLEFFDAVNEAEAQAEVRVVALWQQAIPGNPAAARDFLARRYPGRWGPKETHRNVGKDEDSPIEVVVDYRDSLLARIASIASRTGQGRDDSEPDAG